MIRRKVVTSPTVERQIIDQVFFIAADSIDNALAWETRLRSAIDRLGDGPGHAVDEEASERLGETFRKLVFERTYLVHYRVNDASNAVEVVNFRHGARLPKAGEP